MTAAAEVESPTAERARFERFDAVARFLAAAAAAQPALVVLDDVRCGGDRKRSGCFPAAAS